MEHGDHYTSHEYRNVFWTSFEKYVEAIMPLPKSQVSEECCGDHIPEDEDTHSINDQVDDAESPSNSPIDEEVMESMADNSLASDEVGLSIDDSGNLIPRANQVQDYMSRSFALQDMCIWDFVAQVEKQKIKLSQDHDTTNAFAGDDVTESDFQESMELNQFADTDNTFSAQKVPEKASEDTHDQRVSVEDIMKTKTRLRPSFELLDNHVESKTHRLVVRHPDRRCIPVPI
jgi:hypothetical protein